MAAPPPNLGYNSPLNVNGYVPRSPRTPHLWQSALANFLGGAAGDVAKTAIPAMMSPSATTDAEGQVAITPNEHFWQTKATPEMQAHVSSANAANTEARQRGGLYGAEAAKTGMLAPAEYANLMARTGQTAAETAKTQSMLPVEMRAGNAAAGLAEANTAQVAPSAQSERALHAAQGSLLGAQAGEVAPNAASERTLQGAQAGMLGAQQAQVAPTAASERDLRSAQAKGIQTEADVHRQDVLGNQLSNYLRANLPMKDASGAPIVYPPELLKKLFQYSQ